VRRQSNQVAPVPDFVAPMQAMLVKSIRPGDWIYEIKFDGYRALAAADLRWQSAGRDQSERYPMPETPLAFAKRVHALPNPCQIDALFFQRLFIFGGEILPV